MARHNQPPRWAEHVKSGLAIVGGGLVIVAVLCVAADLAGR